MGRRRHYVVKCGHCKKYQSTVTQKRLSEYSFKCRHCGRSTKPYSKRQGGFKTYISEPMTGVVAQAAVMLQSKRHSPHIKACLKKVKEKYDSIPPHRKKSVSPPTLADMELGSNFRSAGEL